MSAKFWATVDTATLINEPLPGNRRLETIMTNPTWAPCSIIDRVRDYEQYAENRTKWSTFDKEYEIWSRLVTRPEMETVWSFILTTIGEDNLTTNGGLTGKIDRAIRYFYDSARLSPSDYKKEMLEIAKLSKQLAIKLNKFCSPNSIYNPFPFHSLFSGEQLQESARRSKEPYGDRAEKSLFNNRIDSRFPLIDSHLDGLSSRAKDEAENQVSRLRLPRKVNDQNLFRTYFIQAVGDYFFLCCADYSPTRIATFCSVALDDADITADLVRKIFPLDDECKALLAAQRSFNDQQED